MQYKTVFRRVDACYALLMLLNDLFLEQAILCPSTDEQGISSGAKDKQAIQRGAEQTSNSARRGTNKELSEARNIQAIRGAAGQTSNCVFDQSSAFVAKIIYALFRRDPCMT